VWRMVEAWWGCSSDRVFGSVGGGCESLMTDWCAGRRDGEGSGVHGKWIPLGWLSINF
jgi:hypothetical protein